MSTDYPEGLAPNGTVRSLVIGPTLTGQACASLSKKDHRAAGRWKVRRGFSELTI